MGKTIGLKQLAQKKYVLLGQLSPEWEASIGHLPEYFDAIMYGESGNGKTNCAVQMLKALLKAAPHAKAEYVSYEEGHNKTVQDLMIHRHRMLEEIGNRVNVTEAIPFKELEKRISKRQSAKIWVIDSIQAAGLLYTEFREMKMKYVNARKKKILLFISWAEGSKPKGAAAKAIEFDVDIKMYVERMIMFPKSRHGGNKPYVINHDLALENWGKQNFYKAARIPRPARKSKSQSDTHENPLRIADDNSQPGAGQPDSENHCEPSKQEVA